MKRYVREYANDLLSNTSNEVEKYTENVLFHYERGHITDQEAMECLVSKQPNKMANTKLEVINNIKKHLNFSNCELGSSQSDLVWAAVYEAINKATEEVRDDNQVEKQEDYDDR